MVEHMKACCDELHTAEPDMEAVRACAHSAARILEPVLDHWLFRKFWGRLRVIEFKQALTERLEKLHSDNDDNDVDNEYHNPYDFSIRTLEIAVAQ